MKLALAILSATTLLALTSCQPEKKREENLTTSTSAGPHGMVVSAHPIASRVGKEIMQKGGNAIDAAIAVQFTLAVVFPAAGNIGGGGFMMYRTKDGQYHALDFREKAPGKATTAMFLDRSGQVVPNLSTEGHLASGVPGSVDGMVEAHTKFGSLPWKDLLQPAIDLALNGFALTQREAGWMNDYRPTFEKYNTVQPQFLYRPLWKAGDTIRWADLGHTLERIRDNGRAGFYEGKTADDIVAEMKRGKGLISKEDLTNYKSSWRTPITSDYKEYKIISMPPSSSGGVCLIQLLKSVEPYPMKEWGFNSAKSVHLMVEAERRVYADRSKFLGDPEFYKVPLTEMIAPDYNKNRMSSFNESKATPSSDVAPGTITGYESEETTHYSIVDPQGNAVAITTTINGWFGSYVVVSGSGFFLNNEMDDFSSKPGVPNMFGVLGGEANKIEPGKRMLSAMTPTIVEKNGKLHMVLGSPGGSTIITAVFQVILNVTEFGMGMQDAVDAKRVHSQWQPDVIAPEYKAISKDDSLTLVKMGHQFKSRRSIGRVDAILIHDDGTLEGGADKTRGDDTVESF
ncbi:MAG TPA: gamma-glutamyltransferase [Cyclobacteriaceae bacterium]|nr:gamma-glutamyltransferase [Cyclobacteriaceae bacterium]